MRFGVTFFPDVTPDVKSAHQYYVETFELVDFAADLGFMHAKIIEHYLSPYGGYSPDPLQFLAAVAARQPDMRLMTGAVIPAFGHPLQLAARIALLDSMSGGRLDVGLARAFLPHEFDAFGVSMDDSRPLYEESIEAVRRLLTEEEVTFEGRYHRFEKARSLPRPVQQPHPPFYVAAFRTPDSFEYAGKQGMNLMITPFYLRPAELGEMVSQYRSFRADSGHDPDSASVNINFRTYCAPTDREAVERAEPYARHYINMLLEPLERWRGAAVGRSGWRRVAAERQGAARGRDYADADAGAVAPDRCRGRRGRVLSRRAWGTGCGVRPIARRLADG